MSPYIDIDLLRNQLAWLIDATANANRKAPGTGLLNFIQHLIDIYEANPDGNVPIYFITISNQENGDPLSSNE